MKYNPDDDPRLTVITIANRLGVSESFVYEEYNRGNLQGHKLGAGRGRIKFSENQYHAYLQSTLTELELCQQNAKTPAVVSTTKPPMKTSNSVSQGLGKILTQKKKQRHGKPYAVATPRISDLASEDDAYGGRH